MRKLYEQDIIEILYGATLLGAGGGGSLCFGLDMLKKLHDAGNTVVLITHDNSIAVQAERIIRLEDGRVVYDGDSHSPEAVVQPTLLPEQESQTEEA